MRKLTAILAVILVGLVLSASALAGGPEPEFRVALSVQDATDAGLTIRHQVGVRATAHVTQAQLKALQSRGIAYDMVPERILTARPEKPPTREIPPTQVPYGVKMIYGNPGLLPAEVGGGAGVTVAILDTGKVDHADFYRADGSAVIEECVDFTSKKSPVILGSCRDGHGHGTHVTGTIAAAGGKDGRGIFGVAPDAHLFSYKVLNDQGRGYADDIAQAIQMAADHGANIISMSLGSSVPSPDEHAAIQYAVSRGVLVIVAAGNSGPAAGTIAYPAAFAEAMAVAALNPDEVVAYFSSRGITDGSDNSIAEREVEVTGPGRNTISTYKDGGYAIMSGTSMATPHIAGLAAKMWQGSGDATRRWLVSQAGRHDIRQAEQINNAADGYDIAAGYGLPQVTLSSQTYWND